MPGIAKEFWLNNNSSTDSYNKIKNLSATNIIDKNKAHLKIKFGYDIISIEYHQLFTGWIGWTKTLLMLES